MIHSLVLENFRSHKKTTLELDRLTVIRGPHGAGKTSVLLALQYALTGRCEITDEAGRGAEALIRDGAKELRIMADECDPLIEGSQDDSRITRIRNRASGSLTIDPPDFGTPTLVSRDAETWLAANFGPPSILSAVLSTSRFIEMKPKEQKELLAAALPSQRVAISADLQKDQAACDFTVEKEISSAAQADQTYKKFYDHRTGLNREIKALSALSAPERPAELPAGLTPENNQLALREYYKLRDGIVTQRAAALAEHSAKKDKLSVARKQLELYEGQILGAADLKVFEAVIAKSETIGKLTAEVEKLRSEIHIRRMRVAELKKTPKNCSACGQAVDTKDTEQNIRFIEEQLAIDEPALAAKNAQLLKLGDLATATEKMRLHKQAMGATASAQSTAEQLKGLPESIDLSGFDLKLADVDKLLTESNHFRALLAAHEGAQSQYIQQRAQLEKLQGELEHCERVIAAFAPGGPIRSQLIGDRFGEFRQKLLECLVRFGFACTLTLEPYEFKVQPKSRPALAISQLSGAEAFIFGVAFQIALAEATEVPLVVIDRGDTLLPSLREQLTAMAIGCAVPQVIVLAAGEKLPAASSRVIPINLPAGVRFIDLDTDDAGTTIIASSYGGQTEEKSYAAAE